MAEKLICPNYLNFLKVNLPELPQLLETEKSKGKKKLLLRKAVRAPEDVVNDVKNIAEKSDFSIIYDDATEPIVALPNNQEKNENPIHAIEPSEEKE